MQVNESVEDIPELPDCRSLHSDFFGPIAPSPGRVSWVFRACIPRLQPEFSCRCQHEAAATVGVHPDSLDACVGIFIEGTAHAGLGAKTEDGIDFSKATLAPPPPPADVDADAEEEISEHNEATSATGTSKAATGGSSNSRPPEPEKLRAEKPAVTLSFTVDATSDPEKLEKQLKLLRQYGVI